MATEEPEKYLAVLKASYSYEPQSEDEIAIKEDQLLLLVEKVDEDWWRVKIKGTTQDTESPIGLVPAAYVEQAEHSSIVKAVYDYEAAAPGEISVHEDDVLLVFDTEEDWILVQDSKDEGRAGYVPGNYVEVFEEEAPAPTPAPARIVVPDDPPQPTSVYVDPADRVASAKLTSDGIETWAVSEIDKKGKKKKGTLGVGNGAVFFASESDKTPVQKWQTKDVSAVSSEKSKHIRIDIGGSTPISLHFHTGSKDNADAIMGKLHSSKALSSSPPPPEHGLSPEPSLPKKASVHFSQSSPVIIPPSVEVEDEEEEQEEEEEQHYVPPPRAIPQAPPQASPSGAEMASALYDFNADGEDELTVKEGERLTILEKDGEEWWKCRNAKGVEGVVPASYLEPVASGAGASANGPTVDRAAEARKAAELAKQQEAEREEQERHEAEHREKEAAVARKAEAQRKAKEAAIAAEAERAERQKKKEAAAAARAASPIASPPSKPEPRASVSSNSSNSRPSTDVNRPPADQTRVWHDRSGQFRVEAAFLGFKDGKLRLHKVNGVIVEVPSEKMSTEDMRYVEKFLDKKKRPSNGTHISDDDVPLALTRNASQRNPPAHKKAPKIDWFDFFLSAGCDLDDCTRYAASFEKDKIDETILGDITEGTMRSLGLREGDIIRVKKAIEKRKPTENLHKPSSHLQDQVRKDEELARQLQAQENGTSRSPAPNLFAGPGGVLKPRRGRPQPSKSLPPSSVDLGSISSASGHIQRTGSPQVSSPASSQAAALPPRPSSVAPPVVSGFDDDAWTNRPSSTKPIKSASSTPAPRVPSAPPMAKPAPTPTVTAAPPQPTPPAPSASAPPPNSNSNLANTTEADIFTQLARLAELRKTSTPSQPTPPPPQPAQIQPPASFRTGMGMGPSPVPMGQIVNQPMLSPPVQAYNGPRGPFAPVPANQSLLQPLIPTQTGFSGFIPTKPNNSPSPFQNQLSPPFLQSQPTGFHNPSPLMAQPTGAFGNFNTLPSFQGNTGGFGQLQSQPTGFNPHMNQSPFANPGGMASPPPPLPSNQINNATPANVFAQMKSGTFANEDNNSGLNGQSPGWGQSYQGYTGY